MTVPEDHMSVVGVGSTMDIKAFLSVVSNVSSRSSVPRNSLEVLVSVWSSSSGNTNSETLSLLVGNDVVSSGPGSDGLGSPVESEPLFVVLWVVVSNSESILMSTDVLVPEEGSVSWHSGFNLELNTVGEWVSWVSVSNSINVPGLVETIMAIPEDNVSMVMVVSTMYIKALVGNVSNVSSWSTEESHLLV